MSKNTAHFLIGYPDKLQDGIQPYQQLVLTEDSWPLLFLADTPTPGLNHGKQYRHLVTWIPTMKYMMKDILLMVGLHSARLPKLVGDCKRSCSGATPRPGRTRKVQTYVLKKLRQSVMAAG